MSEPPILTNVYCLIARLLKLLQSRHFGVKVHFYFIFFTIHKKAVPLFFAFRGKAVRRVLELCKKTRLLQVTAGLWNEREE